MKINVNSCSYSVFQFSGFSFLPRLFEVTSKLFECNFINRKLTIFRFNKFYFGVFILKQLVVTKQKINAQSYLVTYIYVQCVDKKEN